MVNSASRKRKTPLRTTQANAAALLRDDETPIGEALDLEPKSEKSQTKPKSPAEADSDSDDSSVYSELEEEEEEEEEDDDDESDDEGDDDDDEGESGMFFYDFIKNQIYKYKLELGNGT